MNSIDYSRIGLGMEISPRYGLELQEGLAKRVKALVNALCGDKEGVIVVEGVDILRQGQILSVPKGTVYYQGELYAVDDQAMSVPDGDGPFWQPKKEWTRQAWYGDDRLRETFYLNKMSVGIGEGVAPLADTVWLVDLMYDKLASTNGFKADLGKQVSRAGDSMTGNLEMGGNQVGGLGLASEPGHAVNLALLQSELAKKADKQQAGWVPVTPIPNDGSYLVDVSNLFYRVADTGQRQFKGYLEVTDNSQLPFLALFEFPPNFLVRDFMSVLGTKNSGNIEVAGISVTFTKDPNIGRDSAIVLGQDFRDGLVSRVDFEGVNFWP